jgi:hypothetical protein
VHKINDNGHLSNSRQHCFGKSMQTIDLPQEHPAARKLSQWSAQRKLSWQQQGGDVLSINVVG